MVVVGGGGAGEARCSRAVFSVPPRAATDGLPPPEGMSSSDTGTQHVSSSRARLNM